VHHVSPCNIQPTPRRLQRWRARSSEGSHLTLSAQGVPEVASERKVKNSCVGASVRRRDWAVSADALAGTSHVRHLVPGYWSGGGGGRAPAGCRYTVSSGCGNATNYTAHPTKLQRNRTDKGNSAGGPNLSPRTVADMATGFRTVCVTGHAQL
jgi:hypothetical protein